VADRQPERPGRVRPRPGPQSQHQAEHQELDGVVASIDQPEQEAALGKLVIDAEAGGHQAQARQGAEPEALGR